MTKENELTLRQGLEKFQEKNLKVLSGKSIPKEGQAFLVAHDVAHVVFGCDTSLYGEGIVKIWTTFGTNLSIWKVMRGYRQASAFELSRSYSFPHVAKNILRLLIAIPVTMLRAKQMTKPWPFYDYQAYIDTPIAEIRAEYKINIFS